MPTPDSVMNATAEHAAETGKDACQYAGRVGFGERLYCFDEVADRTVIRFIRETDRRVRRRWRVVFWRVNIGRRFVRHIVKHGIRYNDRLILVLAG